MQSKNNLLYQSAFSKMIFAASVLVFAFWLIGMNANVYKLAVVGAFYELLSLPMLALLILIPVISLVLIIRNKFSLRSLAVYSLLFSLAAVLLMIF